jgi:hypothetical protein
MLVDKPCRSHLPAIDRPDCIRKGLSLRDSATLVIRPKSGIQDKPRQSSKQNSKEGLQSLALTCPDFHPSSSGGPERVVVRRLAKSRSSTLVPLSSVGSNQTSVFTLKKAPFASASRGLSIGSDVSTDYELPVPQKNGTDSRQASKPSSKSSECDIKSLPAPAQLPLSFSSNAASVLEIEAARLSKQLAYKHQQLQSRPIDDEESMITIDDDTEVPEDLFDSLLRAAKTVRHRGQHVVRRSLGRSSLVRLDVIDAMRE